MPLFGLLTINLSFAKCFFQMGTLSLKQVNPDNTQNMLYTCSISTINMSFFMHSTVVWVIVHHLVAKGFSRYYIGCIYTVFALIIRTF